MPKTWEDGAAERDENFKRAVRAHLGDVPVLQETEINWGPPTNETWHEGWQFCTRLCHRPLPRDGT